MTRKKIFTWRRLLGGIAAITLMSGVSFYSFTNYHLKAMYGGHTETVDVRVNTISDREKVFAITNVRILSPNSESFTTPQTVHIRNGIIEKISADMSEVSGVLEIDGAGQFLIPGYTDSHVHLWESQNDLAVFIANGVTQIREMNGSQDNLKWRDEIKAGRLGPDIFVVSPQIANFGKTMGWFNAWTQKKKNATSPAAFIRVVKDLEAQGYDAIKASSFMNGEDYAYLNAAMKEVSVPLVGHIPYFAELKDFWAVDQTAVAHIEEFVKPLRKEFGYTVENADQFLDFVRQRSPEIAQRLSEGDIAVTTTFALINDLPAQITDLDIMLSEAELKYVNPGISEGAVITDRALGWLPDVNRYRFQDGWTDVQKQAEVKYFEDYAAAHKIMLTAMLDADVKVIVGTDTNVPVIVPGFSIHEEMQALNEAGVSNAQILAAVTRVPSKWMKWNTGQVSPGFKANLVLLAENPLENIGATDTIEMVIINGLALSKADLNDLLSSVEIANNQSRKVDIEKWR